MNAKRQLTFLPSGVEVFGDSLRSLWDDGIRCIYAIGAPQWTAALENAARQRGIALMCRVDGDIQGIADTRERKAVIFGETDGEKLSEQLVSCVGLDDVTVVAPVTDWHFSRMPLFLVSIPKAGTHLLYELAGALGYRAGIECPDFPQGQTWYCVEYSNSHTVARDFFVDTVRHAPFGNRHHRFMRSPALFMYRHPLDILVSEAHYYHRDGKTAFAGWLSQCDFEERVERLGNDNWLMGSLRERIGGFLPWMEFPNVVPLSFEELVGAAGGGSDADQRDLIWSIQLKLQAPGNTETIAAAIFNPRSETFRAGQIGGYRTQLPAHAIASWCESNTDVLARFGYRIDGSSSLPRGRAERLRRPIHYSKADVDRLPITVEADFLGCNLVRFDNRIYAVPRAAGTIALEALPAAKLASLPCANSMAEIKSLLLMGNSSLAARTQALTRLAEYIQSGEDDGGFHRYWQESNEPTVIGTYGEFNVVTFRGRFFALRRTLGAVDFSIDFRDLVARYSPRDVVVCASLEALRLEIDGLATGQRTWKEASTTHERISEKVGELQGHIASQEDRIASQETCLSTLLNRVASLEAQIERLQARLAAVGQLEARQAALAQRWAELDARTQDIESSWPTRLSRIVTRVTRGRT